jgi:hypothetical protein
MPRPRSLEGALLLILAVSLFFGGGLGCEPELEGTSLRATSFDGLRYVAFQGKKPPGNGWAVLEYPILPPASLEAMVGVFQPRAFAPSVGADGCVGIREAVQPGFDWRICARYELEPQQRVDVWSTLGANTAQCLGATGAVLRLEDDGVNVRALYTCPGGSETELQEIDSEFDVGEKWFHAFGGYNLGKGAEIGFARLRYEADGPWEATNPGLATYGSFEAFRLGLDAFHELDDDDFGGGFTLAAQARVELAFATNLTISQNLFEGSDVEKDLIKADKSYFKTVDRLFPDRFDHYFKSFQKVADTLACAISDEEDFLD